MSHHVNRVHLFLAAFLIELDGFNFAHHFVSDLVCTFRPSINDFVVLLTLGDQTVLILLFEFRGECFCVVNHCVFRVWNNHVIHTERNTSRTSVTETKGHDLVTEDHRVFLTAVTVDLIDHG